MPILAIMQVEYWLGNKTREDYKRLYATLKLLKKLGSPFILVHLPEFGFFFTLALRTSEHSASSNGYFGDSLGPTKSRIFHSFPKL